MRISSYFLIRALAGGVLLYPALSFSSILNLLTNPPATTGALTIAYTATQVVYNKTASYYKTHNNHCPPAGVFSKQPGPGNVVASIANDNRCATVLQFGQDAPGPLQGKYIAQLPQKNGSTIDFDFPHSVTNIDNGPRKQSLFSQPQKPFAWSPTLQSTPWGNVPSTTQENVLTMTSSAIVTNETSANASSTTPDDGSTDPIATAKRISNIATAAGWG